MLESMIYSVLLGILFFFVLRSGSSSNGAGRYMDLGNNCWLTPEGFVDLTPRLTLEQEWHNQRNKWQQEMDERNHQQELAWSKWRQQGKQYQLMKDKVDAISPEERLEIWLPKWIDYMAQWHLKEKTKDEKEIGYMQFEVFIATEIIPYKWYGFEIVWSPSRVYIEYVV